MYKVHHVILPTEEWASVHVDTLCEAYAWYKCKLAVKSTLLRVVTLLGPNDEVLARVEK